jgi:arylsulfatase A-like enzyme
LRPANGNPVFHGFDWAGLVAEDDAIADGQVTGWISRQLRAETGAPRFIAAGIYRPHEPWYVPQKYFDQYPLDTVELPPVIDNDLDDVPAVARVSTFNSTEMHEWIVAAGRWKEGVQAYLASVTFADAMVGRLLDALDASGRAEHTVIVLFGDHGYHLGQKERWWKMTLWEVATRVPLIIVAPGVTRAGSRSGEAVSLMDLYPTLAELAGLGVPEHVEGQSLVPLLRDPVSARAEPALMTYGFGNHAVRDERYRYIRYVDGSEELYDHRTDPHEWTNLAESPEHARTKAALAQFMPRADSPPIGGAGSD